MEQLDIIIGWLQGCPIWQGQVLVDHTRAEPGHFGLYPMGAQVLQQQEDVLGNRYVRCRSSYRLYRVTTGQQDSREQALWLEQLQGWVMDQQARGLAPELGDLSGQTLFRAEKGRLHKADQVGTAVYCMELTAEYTKLYPARQ